MHLVNNCWRKGGQRGSARVDSLRIEVDIQYTCREARAVAKRAFTLSDVNKIAGAVPNCAYKIFTNYSASLYLPPLIDRYPMLDISASLAIPAFPKNTIRPDDDSVPTVLL